MLQLLGASSSSSSSSQALPCDAQLACLTRLLAAGSASRRACARAIRAIATGSRGERELRALLAAGDSEMHVRASCAEALGELPDSSSIGSCLFVCALSR